MKLIVAAITLGLIIIFSFLSAVIGAGIMIYDVYSGGPNFTLGFNTFCLSLTLFFSAAVAYIVTKILTNTEIMAEVMTKYLESQIEPEPPMGPIHSLFNGMQMPGIQISTIDGNGKITSLDSEGNEELAQRHRDLMFKAFGIAPGADGQKKMENMTINELQAEEKKAIDTQNFELAAVIRDLIEKKKTN